MVVFSFVLTTMYSRQLTAVACTFMLCVLLITAGSTVIRVVLFTPDYSDEQYNTYMWFPPMAMLRSVIYLTYASGFGEEITAENWKYAGKGVMYKTVLWLLGSTVVCLVLLFYFENVCPTGGASKHPFFCLMPKKLDVEAAKDDVESGSGEPDDVA